MKKIVLGFLKTITSEKWINNGINTDRGLTCTLKFVTSRTLDTRIYNPNSKFQFNILIFVRTKCKITL